ncbi:putative uncharacterized protein DDB_G0282133 isoform X2 [Condylostylus longicornis]|nr:putative uncharacterized protein DDB_G0282133 isoform X2 [Condylostylus longicornis]XP_055386562.1 putative uncharacterized protein DDB_G0282133 isoform X2 [Condylostylus longicornis]
MDDSDDSVNNMVSNLPLLFANGYPTSLEKITETQIQKFIPFMVQCSLGNINVPGKEEYNEPEWWPEDIEFSIPITRPKKFQGDWLHKMKEIVKICYQFHKSIFLLRFCNDLAAYEHTWLRFINNHNSTTSLYDRRSNKLLVTFRNENMTYDQPPQKRKCLLQQKARTQNDNQQQQMVEPALFDIYLCDNCDAELYSYEANKEHEKICTSYDDDDVILCNPVQQECEAYNNSTRSSAANLADTTNNAVPTHIEAVIDSEELRKDFLLNFQLCFKRSSESASSLSSTIHQNSNSEDSCYSNHNIHKFDSTSIDNDSNNNNNNKNIRNSKNNSNSNNNDNNNNDNYNSINKSNNVSNNKLTKESNIPRKPGRPCVNAFTDNFIDYRDKKTKITRNNRTIYALARCPNIPFSSPAGQLLIRTFRSYINKEYLTERLDRLERFCATPVLQKSCPRPTKFFGRQRYSSIHSFNCTYKKPQEYSTHKYTFPRRQYYSQYRIDSLKFLNDLILKKRCRPITVRLRKITDNDIKRKRRSSFSSCSSNSIINSDLNIKLIRDQSHGSPKWKITHHQENNSDQKGQQILQLEQHELRKQQRQKHNAEKLIIVDTIDLCSSDEELERESSDIKSKIYINGGLSLAHYGDVQLDAQCNLSNSNELELDINENEEDDDILQIVEECPAQPDHLMEPLQFNIFANSKRPKFEVQKILHKLNNANEITVTPVKKILDPLSISSLEPSSNIILSGASIANSISSNIIEEIRKQNKFEANFLSSNITNSTKPLQPSVFLFSNYTANSNGSSHANSTTMILQQQINSDLNSNSNNQENLIDLSTNNLHKSKNSEDIWLPNNNISNISNNNNNNNSNNSNNYNNNNSNYNNYITNNNNNNHNNNSIITSSTSFNPSSNHIRQNMNPIVTNSSLITNSTSQLHNSNITTPVANVTTNKLLQLQQLMQYVDNNDVINKISSPNRTLSIDLTL